jgi:hypothetical protein
MINNVETTDLDKQALDLFNVDDFVRKFHSWESYNRLFNSLPLLKSVGGKKYTRHKRKNNKRKSYRKKIISRKRF